jgi:hypothetical protein
MPDQTFSVMKDDNGNIWTVERCENCAQFDLKNVWTDMNTRIRVPDDSNKENVLKYAAVAGREFTDPSNLFKSASKNPGYFDAEDKSKHKIAFLIRKFDSHGKPLNAFMEVHDDDSRLVYFEKIEARKDNNGYHTQKSKSNDEKKLLENSIQTGTTVKYNQPLTDFAPFGNVRDVTADKSLADTMK